MDIRSGLVARDGRAVATFVAAALVAFVMFAVLTYAPTGVSVSSSRYFQLLILSGFLLAAGCGYRRGGLVVGWLLAAAVMLPFALSFALTDAPLGREPTISGALATLAKSAGLFGILVGTVGYVVGDALRRLRSENR